MHLEHSRLLVDTVDKSDASYSPVTTELASLSSVVPLLAFIANSATRLTIPTHIRRVRSMALLKLTTLRMTLGDRWDLAFFGLLIPKNGEMVRKTIKKEASSFSEESFTLERQDLWTKLESMDKFGIADRGLAGAVELMVHPSILTKREVMEWIMTTVCLFEEYDAQLFVQDAVHMFKEGVTL